MKKICLKNIFLTFALFVLFINSAFADFSFNEKTLRFAQVSDTHISDRSDTSYKVLSKSKLLLRDVISQINNGEALDFVIFTGDMVDEPKPHYYKEFFDIVSESKYPTIFALGNHDIRTAPKDNEDNSYFTRDDVLEYIISTNENYPFNKTYYSFSPKEHFLVIVLDLALGEVSSNGEVSLEQLNFLNEQIKNHPRDTILIFHHHPLIEPFHSSHHKILNDTEYMNILKQYSNPILIFTGHYHTTKIVKDKNIVHVSTPALVTYPNAFRVVNITDYDDRIDVNIGYNETNLKNVQNKSRADVMSASIFKGIEKYQYRIYLMRKKSKIAKGKIKKS